MDGLPKGLPCLCEHHATQLLAQGRMAPDGGGLARLEGGVIAQRPSFCQVSAPREGQERPDGGWPGRVQEVEEGRAGKWPLPGFGGLRRRKWPWGMEEG